MEVEANEKIKASLSQRFATHINVELLLIVCSVFQGLQTALSSAAADLAAAAQTAAMSESQAHKELLKRLEDTKSQCANSLEGEHHRRRAMLCACDQCYAIYPAAPHSIAEARREHSEQLACREETLRAEAAETLRKVHTEFKLEAQRCAPCLHQPVSLGLRIVGISPIRCLLGMKPRLQAELRRRRR